MQQRLTVNGTRVVRKVGIAIGQLILTNLRDEEIEALATAQQAVDEAQQRLKTMTFEVAGECIRRNAQVHRAQRALTAED